VYLKVERDPKAAALLEQEQNEAILDLLRWARDHRKQQEAEGRTLAPPLD
jgi:hypothetical protein